MLVDGDGSFARSRGYEGYIIDANFILWLNINGEGVAFQLLACPFLVQRYTIPFRTCGERLLVVCPRGKTITGGFLLLRWSNGINFAERSTIPSLYMDSYRCDSVSPKGCPILPRRKYVQSRDTPEQYIQPAHVLCSRELGSQIRIKHRLPCQPSTATSKKHAWNLW